MRDDGREGRAEAEEADELGLRGGYIFVVQYGRSRGGGCGWMGLCGCQDGAEEKRNGKDRKGTEDIAAGLHLGFPLGEERVLERFHNERALSSVVQGARKTTFEGGAFEVGNCGTVVGSSVGITFQGGIG